MAPWTLPTPLAARSAWGCCRTKPGLKEEGERGWVPTCAFYLWNYGSLQSWSDPAAAILALRPRPLLSLLPFQAENKPGFSLHLNPLGVHLIHLFCGATPDLVSLLVLL